MESISIRGGRISATPWETLFLCFGENFRIEVVRDPEARLTKGIEFLFHLHRTGVGTSKQHADDSRHGQIVSASDTSAVLLVQEDEIGILLDSVTDGGSLTEV